METTDRFGTIEITGTVAMLGSEAPADVSVTWPAAGDDDPPLVVARIPSGRGTRTSLGTWPTR